ncbi:serine aminopeptidase domain-containing protein [Spiroplasma endosymbiont of Polydrusus pterygomalis]|uniref:serine aminopeptidase domain-containing protein n=1 Tax=Spiroplasma endosymbiont of Polydrusus pterygomalis TaxID=3139327 RepID=UPI003CCB19B7
MIWNNLNFFTNNNGLYSILISISILIILLTLRLLVIAKIKDNVNVQQAAEMREKVIILRDGYQVKLFKQMIDKSTVIIIGVHGLQGQKDDFKLLSSFCKKSQLSLISYDRRGIGKNEQDWKFKSLAVDINDLKDVISAVKTKYPNQKIIVCGESLGAAIASYATNNNDQVSALIISNLVTKKNLYQFSLNFIIRFCFAFIFNSNIQMPIYIESKDISSNSAHITNMNQRYSNRQNWSLRFLMQFKKINKKSVMIISNSKLATLILQSADDVFSDFHQLKINKKYWKKHHSYVFIFDGKHALINEPNIKDIFNNQIMPWITKNILLEKG